MNMRIAAITDEFSPDLDVAVEAMAAVGMTGAELRVVWGKNIVDLTDEEVDRARAVVEAKGMTVISIASPVLKCVLPDAPAIDERFQQDVFGSKHTFADQPRLAARAFDMCERTGAKILRVFSYWRTVDPAACFDRIVEALRHSPTRDSAAGSSIGLENEHACNIGTGADTARVLAAIDHPALADDLGSRQRARRRRDAVSRRVSSLARGPHRPRARQGLPRRRSHADVGSGR